MACTKIDYSFRTNVTENIFHIRSCVEILANDIKIDKPSLVQLLLRLVGV